jgi:hypothetical protein
MGQPRPWTKKNLAFVRRYFGKETLRKSQERLARQIRRCANGASLCLPHPSHGAIVFAAECAEVIGPE